MRIDNKSQWTLCDLGAEAMRPPPSWPPLIKSVHVERRGITCTECGKPAQGRMLLVHQQRLFVVTEYGEQVDIGRLVQSRMHLCNPCAASARVHGWSVLPRTWREIAAAPHEWAQALAAPTVGSVQ